MDQVVAGVASGPGKRPAFLDGSGPGLRCGRGLGFEPAFGFDLPSRRRVGLGPAVRFGSDAGFGPATGVSPVGGLGVRP